MMKDLPDIATKGQVGVAAALTAKMVSWCIGYRNDWIEPDFADRNKKVPLKIYAGLITISFEQTYTLNSAVTSRTFTTISAEVFD